MENDFDRAMAKDPREDRLPVWAQTKLEALRRVTQGSLTNLNRYLLETAPEESDAVLDPYGNMHLGTGPRGLGERCDVRFPFLHRFGGKAGRTAIDLRISSNFPDWLQVRGGERLRVEFDASNTLRVQTTTEEGGRRS